MSPLVRPRAGRAARALCVIAFGLLCVSGTCSFSSGGGDDDDDDDDTFVFVSDTSSAFSSFALDEVSVTPRAGGGPLAADASRPADASATGAPPAGAAPIGTAAPIDAAAGEPPPADAPHRLRAGDALVLAFTAGVDAASLAAEGALVVTDEAGAAWPATLGVEGARVHVAPDPRAGAGRVTLGAALRDVEGRPLEVAGAPASIAFVHEARERVLLEQRLRLTWAAPDGPRALEVVEVVELGPR